MAFQFDGVGYIENNTSKVLLATGDFTLTFPPFQYRDATKILYANAVVSDAILIRTGSVLEVRIDNPNFLGQVVSASPLSDLDWVTDLAISRTGTNLTVTFAGTTEVFPDAGGTFNPSRIGGSGVSIGNNYDGIINGGNLIYNSPEASYDFSLESGTELIQTAPEAGVGNGTLTGFTTGGFVANINLGGNTAPTVNAGADQNVTYGANVTLTSTESDVDVGDTVTGQWTQVGGTPTVTLADAAAASTTFTAPSVDATLEFRRTVTDGTASAFDEVTINVAAAATGTIEQVVKPTEFDWFASNIWEDGSTDFDVTVLKDIGTTRYVDYALGDDSNDGSVSNPWKTLSYARAQAGVALVILAPGDYWNDCPGTNSVIANSSMSFVCEDGRANIYACSEDDSANFEPDPTRANVYMWVGCPTVYSVWDAGVPTARGFWGFVFPAASADAVRDGDVTARRYGGGYEYYDSATQTLYVKTQDLRQPDKNIKVNTERRWNAVNAGKSVYFEGLNFHFNVLGNTAASTGTQRIAFYKCFAGYGSDFDNATVGLEADSPSAFYFVDSVVANSQIDNISYRLGVRGLELNSQSYDAGIGGPNNCTTGHQSASIIRLNTIYQGCDGPVVGDINTVTSLVVNCIAGGGSAGFNTDDPTTTSWYLNCDFTGGGLGFDGAGTIYSQGNNVTGISGGLTVNNVTNLTNPSVTKEDDTPPLIATAPATTHYELDRSVDDAFALPIATLKDGKAVTTIAPISNNYNSGANGTFAVVYSGQDSAGNDADSVTLSIAQSGVVTNTKPSVVINAPSTLTVNGTAQLSATITDPDVGDTFTYVWTVSAGTLSSSTSATPTFTAPATSQTVTFGLVVNDGTVDSDQATATTDILAETSSYTSSFSNMPNGTYPTRIIDVDNEAILFFGDKTYSNGVTEFTGLTTPAGTNIEISTLGTTKGGLKRGVTV